MTPARTIIIGASAFALAMGSAFAADNKAKSAKTDNDPGFTKLDKDHDGYLSRTEAAANPQLAKRFKEADKDGDGKLSRKEYLTVMTKQDLSKVKQKVSGALDKGKGDKQQPSASAGGTKSK
jgi:Ca2+-binding EF-hand superfamily protein